VLGAAQLLDALDANGGSARAFDFGAILLNSSARSTTSGSRAALRSTVSPLASNGRHHQVFGAGDGDAVEMHGGAAQPIRRDGFDVAVRLVNARASCSRPKMCRLMGRAPDGAAARQRHTSPSRARAHQRPSTRLEARMVFTSS